MRTHLIKMMKRSLLSAIIFAVIVAVFQLQADFQGIRPQSLAVQLTQKQVVQNAVVAVESIGMTVSDMDRAIEFYSSVLSFKKGLCCKNFVRTENPCYGSSDYAITPKI